MSIFDIDINNIKAEFVCSAADYKTLPGDMGDEFCILGRSNVGKSSFINHLFNNKKLARVSKKPGKTSLANFYSININRICFVDLPGYGYAKTSKKEIRRWSSLITDYCEKREFLCGIIWLVDSRHIGNNTDNEAYEWLKNIGLPIFPVLTKSDKLNQKEMASVIKKMKYLYPDLPEPVKYTITKFNSRINFWNKFLEWLK